MASLLFVTLILFLQCVCTTHADDTLRFMVLGDWGGLPLEQFNYSTPIERGVAGGMATLASAKPQDFVVALGFHTGSADKITHSFDLERKTFKFRDYHKSPLAIDAMFFRDNFYFTGVDDVEDDRFYQTYEDVFDDSSLQIPWLVCAGNHDHYGNVTAQIDYTKKSDRWYFPDLFHTSTWTIGSSSATVQIVLIDTIVLCGNIGVDQDEQSPPGPRSEIVAMKELLWIKNVIKSSTADYILVGGHYPVYSAGMHGSTECLINHLKPILDEYKVSAYFAGHDHNNQHLAVDGLDYFVSGCATFAQDWKKNEDNVPPGSLKFFWADKKQLGGYMAFEVNASEMIATFMSGSGNELHKVEIKPRSLNKIAH